jgi:hypothetical protein
MKQPGENARNGRVSPLTAKHIIETFEKILLTKYFFVSFCIKAKRKVKGQRRRCDFEAAQADNRQKAFKNFERHKVC